MTGRINRFIALFLVIALLASPLSETKLYAAELEESTATEETVTEPVQESAAEDDAESSTEESESEPESSIEADMESSTEEESGSESSSPAEENTESGTEEESESEPELPAQENAEYEIEEESEYFCPVELEPENIPYDENQEEFTDKLINSAMARSVFPECYDAREEGYLPAVRNQGRWGACWSFSLIGAMEVSMIRDVGTAADQADLSERHLAFFGYNTGYDELDNANDDTMTHSPEEYYLIHGGNDRRGIVRLMNWNGGAAEEAYPYSASELPDALERTAAQDVEIYLENAYSYNFAAAENKDEAIKAVKKMIMDYGAVSWSYYNASDYLNSATGAYYNNVGGSGSAKTNHAIMAVGWDDSYSKENFKEDIQPENDGAWIIRNSWGEKNGEDGYYYISYEDVSLGSGNPVYAVTVCDTSKYDNNYFYGNTAYSNATIAVRRAAQVYQIKSEKAVREKLAAVSFLIGTSDVDYELQIYKNPDMEEGVVTNPTSGTPMLDAPQTGTTGYPGLYTIELDTPVVFDADDYAAIVLTFPETKPNMYFDRSYTTSDNDGKTEGVHVIAEGQSFFSSGLTSWTDNYNSNRTFRINALTVDCDDVVEVPEIRKIGATEAQGFDEFPKINIRWSKCTAVDSYRLYRSENGGDYELIYTADSSTRSYTDILSERKAAEYSYKVEAVYGDFANESEAVSQKIVGGVEGPELTLSDYDGYEAVLTWNRVSGADVYELWRLPAGESEDGEYVYVTDFAADAELSYMVDTSSWELGYYYYKMRAKQGDEYTGWSEACINRDLIWRQDSYYQAYFEWLPVENAVSYKLYHKANGKTFSVTTANSKVSVSMNSSSYLPCDEHQYYVAAYDAQGNVIDTSSTIVFRMTPDRLNLESVEYDYGNAVTLTWRGGEGADEVEVYRSEAPSEQGVLIKTVDAQTAGYTDNVYKGKNYYYSLTPITADSNGERVEGQTIASEGISTLPEAAIPETAQYIKGEGVSLIWTAARGAEGYLIERSDNAGEFFELAVAEGGDTTAYTDKSVEEGNTYQYRILSYYTTENESRAAVSAVSAIKAAVVPDPVELLEIAELKREDDKTRVALSWNMIENAQSYAVYRSVVSDGEAGSYACVAEDITEGQYIDSTAAPDTSYSYKLIVTVNGLKSELEKTQDRTITTKPVLEALNMSAESVELARNTEQELTIVPTPVHYPYEQELVWSACDENGNALDVRQENDTLVINGTDGREILCISDNKIHALCDSETVKITLTAAIDEIYTTCNIFVYNNDFWVRGVKDLIYTGKPLTQSIEVYDGDRLLTQGVDYSISYKNNVKVSADVTKESKKPAVIVKGKGSYTGTQTVYFEILPEPAEDAGKKSVLKAAVKNIGVLEYTGEAVEPKPVVKDGSKTLTEGIDYELSYENNNAPGNAVVIISGIGDSYKGTKRVSFKIHYNIQYDKNELMRVELETPDVPYAKGGSKPKPEVWCGSTLLKEGTDYKLSYKNNKAIADTASAKAPTVIITGKGSFKGKKELTFNIVKQDIGALTLTAKDKCYTERAGSFTTSFVITDKDGKKLSAGKDYDKASIIYTYADTGEPVGKTDVVQAGTTLCITVNALETGAYSGTISGEYRISAYDISKAKITVEAQNFTGNEIEPNSDTGVQVTYKGYSDALLEGVDYMITGYENNVQKGTAKLYIKGIGDFCGTKTVKFKIRTKNFKWWWED